MRNNNFDLLRLIAAIQVLLMHANTHIMSVFGYSLTGFWAVIFSILSHFPGVHVLFLISGFLIAMSYEKNPKLKDYAINRLLRIYPALYVNIFIGILILFYFDFVQLNSEFFWWLLAQISIVQFFNAEMFRGFGVGVINGVVWTISVELVFYIIVPFLIYLYNKNKFLVYSILLASYLIFDYVSFSNTEIFVNKLLKVTILPYLFLFITGIVFYKHYDTVKRFVNGKFIWWLLLFIAIEVIKTYFIVDFGVVLSFLVWIVFPFMIFSFAFSFRGLSNFLLKRNDFTYGIYIYIIC